ncbi:MAG: hypothetical protein ACYCUG_12875, partial [Acidimicrobiales bacterium]
IVSIRADTGGLAAALELVDAECARDPADAELQGLRARLLARVANLSGLRGEQARQTEERFSWPLPLPEQLSAALPALDRLADRTGMVELRRAVSAFVAADDRLAADAAAGVERYLADAREAAGLGPRDELGDGVTLRLDAGADGKGTSPASESRSALLAMATEWVWLGGREEEEEDEGPSILELFAADPATPPAQAEAARAWQRHVRYGLWQPQLGPPGDRLPGPGTWATDLVTRRVAYLAIPPRQIDGLPRWSVLAGAVVPIGGVWRTVTAMVVLDPRLANRVTDSLVDVTAELLRFLAREAGLRPPKPRRPDRDGPAPHGVLAELADAMDDAEADLTAKVVGASLPNIIGLVQHSSRELPSMTNTDGDPVELLEAVFPAGDSAGLRRRLLADPDFEGVDEDAVAGEVAPPLRWLGRPMTPDEAAGFFAQAQAELRRRGLEPLPAPDGPHRWLRGLVRFQPGAVRVEVNSRRRLAAVTAKLRAAGAGEPAVSLAVDPALDLPSSVGRGAGGRAPGDREAEDAWRMHWLDERVPALGGTTPRSAAKDPRRRVLLESLLREFEHDADLAAAAGEVPLDVDRLRADLDMADGV